MSYMTKIVKVIHPTDTSKKQYNFKTNLDLLLGDIVICDTKKGIVTGIVVSLEGNNNQATRWIFDKVDINKFDKQKKIANLMYQLEIAYRKIQSQVIAYNIKKQSIVEEIENLEI